MPALSPPARLLNPLARLVPAGLSAALGGSLLLSVGLHLVVLVGLTFAIPQVRQQLSHLPLEIMLVNSKTREAPQKADALAQANLAGGGNTDQKNQTIKSPFPPSTHSTSHAELERSSRRQQELEQQVQQVLTQLQQAPAIASAPQHPQFHEEPRPGETQKHLQQTIRNMARLDGQISQQLNAYQTRPKVNFVGARVSEASEAIYLDQWRQKIERVGTVNYPQSSQGQRLTGRLQLVMCLSADGSLYEKPDARIECPVGGVTIERSSGNPELDRAALRIARQSAPFGRFTDEMRRKYDVYLIVRTWTFTQSSGLSAD
jgi:protein TonB